MLDPNPETRFSSSECLKHEWFKVAKELENDEEKDCLDITIVKNIKDFKAGSLFKKKAINVSNILITIFRFS